MDVLIIRFSSLGDVILASAVVEALHRRHPDAVIHFLTKQAYRDVFAADERIGYLVGIEGSESPAEIVRLLGNRTFDAVIDLHRTLRSISVAALVKSPLKTAVRKHGLARRLMILSRNRYRRSFDVLGSYLDTVRRLGVDTRVLPRIIPAPGAVIDAKKHLASIRGTGRVIGLAPGARHAPKRWDTASFAALADMLAKAGHTPVFLGDSGDREVIEQIRAAMRSDMHSFAGELSLADTIGMMSAVDAMVTNDSGPMHIAGALGVPFVALFGPTHPDLGFCPGYPRGHILTTGESCSPCSLHGATACRFAHRRCMQAITPARVFESLNDLITG